jgi:hypothetical protein
MMFRRGDAADVLQELPLSHGIFYLRGRIVGSVACPLGNSHGATRAMRLCSPERVVSFWLARALGRSLLIVFAIASIIANQGSAVAGTLGVNKNGESTAAYYLEFHARGGLIGHTFMIAGRVLDSGRRVREHHFGFSPAANDLTGNLESLVGTPGNIGPQPLDFKMPPLVRFSVRLSHSRYRQLERALRRARIRTPTFRLLSVNCNYFAGYIARSVGLRASAHTLVIPAEYIRALARLNSRPPKLLARGNGKHMARRQLAARAQPGAIPPVTWRDFRAKGRV